VPPQPASFEAPDLPLFPNSDAPGSAGEATAHTGGHVSPDESAPSAVTVGPDADYWLL
jgi:hypothetical protein